MGLPNWNADGLLPPGIHSADLAEIYERFVEDAPNRGHRELLFSAFHLYYRLVRRLVPSGKLWVDGGFGTQKGAEPHDVDVVVLPADWSALASLPDAAQRDFLGLLTHQDVIVGSLDPPAWWSRIQPVGGVLDGFVCHPGHEALWAATWSSVKGDDGLIVPGMAKGFVEVVW
jgi:hypothetical protein